MSHNTNTRTDVRRLGKRIGIVVGLAFAAYFVGELVVFGIVFGTGDALGTGGTLLVSILGLQAMIALTALAFLRTVLEPTFVSIERPTRPHLRTAALATAATLAVAGLYGIALQLTDLEAASTIPVDEELGTTVLLVVFVLSVFLPPITEELLFRGLVQRYVREVSSTAVGIAVATALFVPMHGSAILLTASDATAALGTLGLLTGVSIVIGLSYARTDNLVVPVLVHASYNAIHSSVLEAIAALL